MAFPEGEKNKIKFFISKKPTFILIPILLVICMSFN